MSLCEAVADNSFAAVKRLLSEGVDINERGADGTTPLCAASLWGNDQMVKFLLESGADVLSRNEGTNWTALHAASLQEHGKVVKILLENRADPNLQDNEGRTPAHFGSVSEAIWPFFAARGCARAAKSDLIKKGIIRKAEPQAVRNHVEEYTRPGSAYIRVQQDPFQKGRSGTSSRGVQNQIFIDPLADDVSSGENSKFSVSMKGLGL